MLKTSRYGKINSLLERWDKWLPAAFFCCVLGLYLTMITNFVFVDELDVFYGGYNIVKSGDIYKFYPSQHMPFSYYLAAPGALLGARTLSQFRLYFYVLLSGLWTGIYIRNRKHFSRLALLLLPLLYVVQLQAYELGTMMISDHWQGIGLMIILLELLRYADEKKISAGMACMIALGILLSFGTTFLSAYPLLMIFLGATAMQIIQIRKKERKLSDVLKEDGRLTLICLCPFLLLGLWYLISGNLGNAFGGAYDLNVNIYSKYLSGFGTSPGGTFLSVFPGWIQYQAKSFVFLREDGWHKALQVWLQTAALAVFLVSLWKDKKRIAGITFLLTVLMTGVRGFEKFHSMPYIATVSIPMAFCLDGALSFWLEKKTWRRALPAAAALVLAAAFVLPEARIIRNLTYVPQLVAGRTYRDSNRDMLEVVSEPGERIHTDDLYYSGLTVMRSGLRLAEACPGAGSPWFYEFYGERELNNLKDHQTRLLVMDLEGEIWGYRLRDYAADLVTYVEENYTNIGPNLYIRNEEYPAALEKLRDAGYGTKFSGPAFGEESRIGTRLSDGMTCDQRITAEGSRMTGVLVRLATYLDQNTSGATLQLIQPETGEVIAESTLPKEEIKDNIYTRFALNAETEPGEQYILRITTDGTAPEGTDPLLALYCYTESSPEDPGAFLDGEKQDFDWAALVEYDAEG